ncbi:hypothetical protein ANOM_003223 [Aspergillus nomiae NRRL 13137]|uniref:DUF1479 domain protein n=1 Tax=Aspergillus nomiae NRRL (strain ATCC 15546 / NRRL 13137 / CBS 260.88 / M93) TaxID=1509407 RepID=A0A0L1J9P4_ASPN3|nr:uncharacterized protein ANOM_003223 [Aspergillus nomiae NRRL 13137]KNG88506.1 hypothetical protein ANOM_003223 [Aspergillus nomiae NRRL 13137]
MPLHTPSHLSIARHALKPLRVHRSFIRQATSSADPRKEGDISSVFVSLSGKEETPLPPRRNRKKLASLLHTLKDEVRLIHQRGSDIIPSIEFKDIHAAPKTFRDELRKRGVAVIRGVVPEHEARAYKDEIEDYVKANPGTKAFPPHDPQVYELYWSQPQMRARTHPNMLEAQRFLMSFWHSNSPDAMISPTHPLIYADRLRIRQPGDAGFALGPHVDGGGPERWEDNGYGRGNVYQRIWQGGWEEYDPWEASCRVLAETDLYNGAGACSMFRMFQAWLGMSHTGPNEGTLLVNPLLSLATAYFLLRPFFEPIYTPPRECSRMATETFLHPSNWRLERKTSSNLQGATPGFAQELTTTLHPHLELDKTMVHVPKIAPGDYVAWHCDTIHAVDRVHNGSGDSSVLYIPACPVTEANANYVKRQRNDFREGVPPPDFPGGKGESEHVGRATETCLRKSTSSLGLRSLGLDKWDLDDQSLKKGQRLVLDRSNQILGF